MGWRWNYFCCFIHRTVFLKFATASTSNIFCFAVDFIAADADCSTDTFFMTMTTFNHEVHLLLFWYSTSAVVFPSYSCSY
jgi:hypothetical protein